MVCEKPANASVSNNMEQNICFFIILIFYTTHRESECSLVGVHEGTAVEDEVA